MSSQTFHEIKKATANVYGITVADIDGTSRLPMFTRPRQMAMFLCRKLTSESAPAVGRAFRRDHTTILHAEKKLSKRMLPDESDSMNAILKAIPQYELYVGGVFRSRRVPKIEFRSVRT